MGQFPECRFLVQNRQCRGLTRPKPAPQNNFRMGRHPFPNPLFNRLNQLEPSYGAPQLDRIRGPAKVLQLAGLRPQMEHESEVNLARSSGASPGVGSLRWTLNAHSRPAPFAPGTPA